MEAMDQTLMRKTAERVTRARALLLKETPFFGHLALGLQLACAPCGTACTDGSRLIFDPDFAKKLDDRELTFVILHEVLHCALDHCTRGKVLNHLLHNAACDIVVNSTILQMWGLESFSVAGEEPMHKTPKGKEGSQYSSEEVYAMLLGKYKDIAQADQAFSSSGIDRHDLWQGIESPGQLRDEWNRRILEAARACGGEGSFPKSVRELIRRIKKSSQVNWKQVLHDFLQQDRYDYSFLPPDRRFASGELLLPAYNLSGEEGEAKDLWVCVDTSASITDRELSAAMDEILDAMRQAGLEGMISYFDSSVTSPAPFSSEEELLAAKPLGGGGTSFTRIFSYMKEELYPKLPRAILIFTDGLAACPPEEAAMDVPVIWLVTKGGKTDMPWGTVLEYGE